MGKKATSNWPKLLDLVSRDDELYVRPSGYWAQTKLYALCRYVELTTRAMVGKPFWSGVNYVDLFCGPGICVDRESGERFPGSPLIAAHAPKAFSKILLCELDPAIAEVCEKRLSTTGTESLYRVFRGNANEIVREVTAEIPKRSLTLAFLDPTGLHVHMDTVVALSDCGRVDLVILFADAMDILRNHNKYYFNNSESNLDLLLGRDSGWREQLRALDDQEPTNLRRLYREIYIQELGRVAGFSYFDTQVIYGRSGPLYSLIYASKDPLGLKFWRESIKKQLSGQTSFW